MNSMAHASFPSGTLPMTAPFPLTPHEVHQERPEPGLSAEQLYRDEVGSPEVLRPEEVTFLAQCMERGRQAAAHPSWPGHREVIKAGEQARQRLIEANLRLVLYLVRLHYQDAPVDLMDLIQEGNLGLIHAVEKYDYRKGPFASYALFWIHQAISTALCEQGQIIRLPLHLFEKLKQVKKARQAWIQSSGQEPSLETLAVHVKMRSEQLAELLALSQILKPLSLEYRQRVGEDEVPLGDLLEDTQATSPEQMAERHTLTVLIRETLQESNLTLRERAIIGLRYGLNDGCERTLMEVGRELGLSHEAVRQNEQRARKKLEALLHRRHLHEFLE